MGQLGRAHGASLPDWNPHSAADGRARSWISVKAREGVKDCSGTRVLDGGARDERVLVDGVELEGRL